VAQDISNKTFSNLKALRVEELSRCLRADDEEHPLELSRDCRSSRTLRLGAAVPVMFSSPSSILARTWAAQ
jgi:hypothetical protein